MNHVPRRSIIIAGRKTSITLEDAFWIALKEIARGRNMPLSDLVAAIDSERHLNLSSAIRMFVLDFCVHISPADAATTAIMFVEAMALGHKGSS